MIETRGLSKAYSRGLYALQDLTLSIAKGEFVFLTGPSGAGKSTLLRLLLMQERPTEGMLSVNGYDLSTLKRHEIQEYRRGMGIDPLDRLPAVGRRIGQELEDRFLGFDLGHRLCDQRRSRRARRIGMSPSGIEPCQRRCAGDRSMLLCVAALRRR